MKIKVETDPMLVCGWYLRIKTRRSEHYVWRAGRPRYPRQAVVR